MDTALSTSVHTPQPKGTAWSALPAWPTTFPDRLQPRLRQFFSGMADTQTDPPTLANATADFPQSQFDKWAQQDIDCCAIRFEHSGLFPTAGSTTMDAGAYAALKHIVRGMMRAGKNIILAPQDNLELIYTSLHSNTAGIGHYNWAWLSASWIALIAALEADLVGDGFCAAHCMISPVCEMGGGVSSALWSMTTYNSMWATVIPAMRASLLDYTFIIVTYPTGAINQYKYDAGAGDVYLSLPADTNLVVSADPFGPKFVWQGYGEEESGMAYIGGLTWGMTKAQIGTAIAAIVDPGGNAARTAQITWWKANWASQIETAGFSPTTLEEYFSGFFAYCAARQRVPHIGQWSCLSIGAPDWNAGTVSAKAVSPTQANLFEADLSAIFKREGVPNVYWLRELVDTDRTRAVTGHQPGAEVFVASRMAANVASRAPMSLSKGLPAALHASANLAVWHDCAYLTRLDGKVTVWADLSGNLNHGVGQFDINEPQVGLSSQNGFSPLFWDNTDRPFLNMTTPVVATAYTIIVAARVTARTDDGAAGNFFTNNAANIQNGLRSVAKTMVLYDGSQSTTTGVLPVDPIGYSVLCWSWSAATGAKFYQNGVLVASAVDFGTPAANVTLNAICSFFGGGAGVDIPNTLGQQLYTRQLSAAEILAISNAYRTRFSI